MTKSKSYGPGNMVVYLNLEHLYYISVGIDSEIIINIFLAQIILKLRL